MNWRLSFWCAVSAFVAALIIGLIVLLGGDKLSLSLRTVTVSGDAATYTMELDLNAEWVLIATPGDWCHVDPYMGNKGRAGITVVTAANPHQEMREAKLTFYSGNVTKEILLQQQPGHRRTVAVATPPVARPQPVAPVTVKPKQQPRTVTTVKPKPATQLRTVAKPKPQPAATPKPVQSAVSATVPKAPKQEPVKQEQQVYVKEEPVEVEQSIIAGPCTPAEKYKLTASSNFVCSGQPVIFTLSNSQSGVSYQLYRDGKPVGGYMPGKGSEITFPGSFAETGVYTARSVATTGYCATNMEDAVKLIVAEKFDPGKIDSYKVIVTNENTPPVIKSLTPARGGDGKISYRWAVNGRLIEGATGESYQPAAVTYNAVYTRMAHDETCNIPWKSSAGTAVVTIERVPKTR